MNLEAFSISREDLPHYTYDNYVQWEGQWEIIYGIPYAMAPSPSKKHQRLSVKIASQLDSLLENANCNNCMTYLPIDWQISEDTVVQPDVLVVCGDNPEEETLLIAPVLVFEILSPSTARKDKILKYQLYEKAGVKYYCIVDPAGLSAEVFTLRDIDRQYQGIGELQEGKMTFDFGECSIVFDFTKIFAARG